MALSVIAAALFVFLTFSLPIYVWRIWRPSDVPPTRNKGRRLLPVLAQAKGFERKTCGQCHFFEPTGFEEMRRRAPAAAEAAKWLSPGAMSASEKGGWDASSGFDPEGQPLSLGGPRWEEIGVCNQRKGLMTFPESQCPEWR
jgi:hypothetical protein